MNIFKSFEKFSEAIYDRKLLLQYKILFRRWDLLDGEIDEGLLSANVKRPVQRENDIEWESTTFSIQHLLEWNAGYYNKAKCKNILIDNEIDYYTTAFDNNLNLLELFFLNEYPVLNTVAYEEQMRASQCLIMKGNPNFHLILDEVGTGKTVSAQYCIRDILAEKGSDAKILVICPNNKKREWQKDIKRQLGLYAHVASDIQEDFVYKGDRKSFYFRRNEPSIFIEGQKANEMTEDFDFWGGRVQVEWDFIIIDEGHQCFNSYKNLKAKKAILLTATPIVVNSITDNEIVRVQKVRLLQDYVDLLCKIVGNESIYELNDLFSDSPIFTQLFREDLKILPKKRNIIFKHCNRWEKRSQYLDVLGEVKGGMTKLLYGQDDDFLIEGVFSKFRKDIEAAGYMLDEIKPIIEAESSDKYNVLKKYIEENKENSYIVFFNVKWPADQLYKRLINDSEVNRDNLIIAKKYGGKLFDVWPRDNSVTLDNIFSYLMNKIDQKKRVIFITTGASGGTGLNLGNFDGVINYELPFTSLELEQRFGRVDRMDYAEKNEKEMVFILNNDENPMLRYSSLKINKTCEYMPIRNTVLFYKEFIDANIDSLKTELAHCELSNEDASVYKSVYNLLSKINEQLDDKPIIEKLIKHIVKQRTLSGFNEDISNVGSDAEQLIELFKTKLSSILKIYQIQKTLPYLDNEIKHWCNLLGQTEGIEIESYSNIVADGEEMDEYESKQGEFEKGDSQIEANTVLGSQIIVVDPTSKQPDSFLLRGDLLKHYFELDEKLNNLGETSDIQVSTGLFYVRNGKYYKQSVEDYRNSFKGGAVACATSN